MAEKEEELPKHIEEFYKKSKKLDILEVRTLRSWGEAYNVASKEVIKDDVLKLKDKDSRKKFAKKMSDYLLNDAKKYFKMDDEKLDDITEARIMQMYAGTTKSELDKLLEDHQEDYSLQRHNQTANQSVFRIMAQLRPIEYEHLESEHTSDIAKHVGLDEGVLPELTHKSGLAKVLKEYDKNGHVSKKMLTKLKDDPHRYSQDPQAYMYD